MRPPPCLPPSEGGSQLSGDTANGLTLPSLSPSRCEPRGVWNAVRGPSPAAAVHPLGLTLGSLGVGALTHGRGSQQMSARDEATRGEASGPGSPQSPHSGFQKRLRPRPAAERASM